MNSKPIRVALIEDEKPAARMLHGLITDLRPDWEVELLPGNVTGAVQWFATHPHPDIVFLDIHLSDGNSFLFIEQAQPQSAIIFTTAYDEYAVKAFTVNSIDYLLKPIHRERLEEAIVKYERLIGNHKADLQERQDMLEVLRSLTHPEKKYRTRFLITGVDKSYMLQVDDIALFHVEGHLTQALTFTGQEHTIDMTLDRLSEQLDPDLFFRANRQTIVHIKAIVRIAPYFQHRILIYTRPEFKEKILVSREKATAFKMWLNY